jgi:hypothetical protein
LGHRRLSKSDIWRLADCDWAVLDEDVVVRSSGTGSAHLLEGDAGVLFEALTRHDSGVSIGTLLEELAIAIPESEREGLQGAVESALVEFSRCGFAARIPSP